MHKATVSIFFDKYHPKKNGKHSISIRVIFRRKKKYYPTGIELTSHEYQRFLLAERRNENEIDTKEKLNVFETKANEAKNKLKHFSFELFEHNFLDNQDATNNVFSAFDKKIIELEKENRLGTASSYTCAKNSLNKFKADFSFIDVNIEFLNAYEKWMLEKGKSPTTIGIYLRNLRSIYNQAQIDNSLSPFRTNNNKKYSIPEGLNIKKAIKLDEISGIYNYKTKENSSMEMAKDYWIFIFLCNGINVKDLCLLKRKNYDEKNKLIKFTREKTKRTKKKNIEITISIKPLAKSIIDKYSEISLNPDAYLFPNLNNSKTFIEQRMKVQQLTKTINKYMKRIGKELEINKPITTYCARHSFSTILRDSGATIDFISAALGHSSTKMTMDYLDQFTEEKIHETTDILNAAFK